jgi:outer membrane protein assembly factor BamB
MTYVEKLSFSSPRIISLVAVLLGLLGFILIPVIAIGKWYMRDDLAGIKNQLNLKLFLDPGFVHPFFLGTISLGFLLWFFIEKKKDGFDHGDRSDLSPVLTFCAAIIFILLNYGRQDPFVSREIICIDRHSGITKWKREVLIGPAADCSNYNSQATPTPLIDSNSVYAYFGSAGLVATDHFGNIKWKNCGLPFKSIHGAGASPVLWKGGIIILSSMSDKPYLTSLDKKTGREQWKTNLPAISGVGGEYRTPMVFESDGKELILEWSTARSQLVIYEAKTGMIVCQFNTTWAAREEAIATPCIYNGVLYLSDIERVVALDIIRLIKNDSPIMWDSELKGRGPTTSSPVLSHGSFFMISDNGITTCMDSKTGDISWQKKLKGVYFASPVSIGNNIHFSNSAGITTVIESSNQYKQIAENVLPEGIYSSFAPVDGQLFIRTKNTLWCVK